MKIIINTPNSDKNGHTFEVICFYENGCVTALEETLLQTTLKPTEFYIVDLQSEMQRAYDSFNWNSSDTRYHKFLSYCKAAGIAMPKVEYNCPA
jgi:hypothetical protein